ncbi:VOC family protein [Streptomyces sp. NPDC001922]|uniref:VOC family protein n=1 Tax=Streptomyces sp. NPDC001922 TaxID=3364624 RepID=UPI00368C7015
MIGNLQCVVLDCPDPRALARFYAAVLGGEVDRPDRRWSLDEEWSTLHTPGGPVLAFQRAADHRPPRWPDPAHPQQFHLDVGVSDLDAAEARVLALGATRLDPAVTGSGSEPDADTVSGAGADVVSAAGAGDGSGAGADVVSTTGSAAGSGSVSEAGSDCVQDEPGWRVYTDPAGHPFCLVRE